MTSRYIFYSLRTFLFIAIFFAFKGETAFGQRFVVENVSFVPLENQIIFINYDLNSFSEKNRRYNVKLFLKQESNPELRYRPGELLGDIGTGRFEGEGNLIIWSMKHDEERGFRPDPFFDDYYFVVEARRRTGLFWWFLTAAAGGAAYHFFVEPIF